MRLTVRKESIGLIIVLIFYAVFSLWFYSFSSFPIHRDGMYYDTVARNISKGRGFNIDFIWHYGVKPANINHPVGNVLNPLGSIITAVFYYIFGISKFSGQLPMLLFYGIILILIYRFCREHFDSRWIATSAVLIFATHPHLIVYNAGGGSPEGYLLFFVYLTILFLGKAVETQKNIYFYLSAIAGGLSYLSRNEGGLTLILIIMFFFYKRKIMEKNGKEKINLKVLFISIALFFVVVSPWEIRNRLLYGGQANVGKYNYIFGSEYYDFYSYSKVYTPISMLKVGFKKLVHRLIVSYGMKIDQFINVTTWPIAVFMLVGFPVCFKKKVYLPVIGYFVISYLMMGFLNRLGFQGGWNGIYLLLPFIIPMCLEGISVFSSQLITNERKVKMLAILISSIIIVYNLGSCYKIYYLNKNKPIAPLEYTKPIKEWFEKNNKKDAVIFTYQPIVTYYYTGLKTVQIPTSEPPEVIFECMERYKVDYLILDTPYFKVLNDLYYGKTDYGRFKLVYETVMKVKYGESGEKLKIFKVLNKKNS